MAVFANSKGVSLFSFPRGQGRSICSPPSNQGQREARAMVKKSDEETGLLTVAERFTDPPAENLCMNLIIF
ncbi:unnamed protein product [Ilex paraguariensis]|uniref:Uncharacterized protein n=1 Tax=Ilex paraguariensis TaxID=185542 RepID=A0ABC8TEQ2_9AQUA